MATHQQLARHPMPVDRAIHWKPLRDPHYVLALLRRDFNAPGEVFIRQAVLARIEQLARATPDRFVVGLLVGRRFQCSVTISSYAVIESLVERAEPVASEASFADAIADEMARRRTSAPELVIGWYSSTAALDARPSAHVAAVHHAHFKSGWQTAVVVASAASTEAGAVFAYDSTASRFFHLPFYELAASALEPDRPKPTCITWPQYMTTEPVVRVAVGTVAQAPPAPRVAPGNHAAPRRSIWLSMRSLRATGPANGGQRAPASPQRGTNGSVHGGGADHGGERAGTRTGTVGADRKTSDRGAQKTPRASAPAPHEAPADENNPRKARNASAAQIVRRIDDSEDTVLGEDPERYLELARSEGFYVAARFDGTAPTTGPNRDTLWLLNDPFSGLLLTVVGHGSAVIDASLHYNVRTDDPDVFRRVFAEHRDPDSQTVYVRESCVEMLRARCRRLRAGNALQRMWQVPATIYFLTPTEWQAVIDGYGNPRGGAEAVRAINAARIAALAPAVRRQFRLGAPVEDEPDAEASE